MSSIKYWLSKGSFSLLNRASTFLFGFTTYLFLVRYLTKEEFGLYSLYMVITALIETGRNSFLQNAFTKFYHDEGINKHRVTSASLILNVCFTLFFSLIIYSLSTYLGGAYDSRELSEMLKVYAVGSFLLIPSSQMVYYLSANMDFKKVSLLSNARYATFFVAMVVCFFFFQGLSLTQIIMINVGSLGAGTSIAFIFFKISSIKHYSFDKKTFKDLLNFGKYTLGVGLTSMMTRSIDQLMIGLLISAEAVASYNIARRFLNMLEVPINAVANVSYPKMAQSNQGADSRDRLSDIFNWSSGVTMAIIAPAVLLLFTFPAWFIQVVAGAQYLDAVPVLQILLAYHIFKPLAVQTGGVLEVLSKPKIGFYMLVLQSSLNIVLNYVLIRIEGPLGGVVGAAIASFVSSFIYLFLLVRILKKDCDVSFKAMIQNVFGLYQTAVSKLN